MIILGTITSVLSLYLFSYLSIKLLDSDKWYALPTAVLVGMLLALLNVWVFFI